MRQLNCVLSLRHNSRPVTLSDYRLQNTAYQTLGQALRQVDPGNNVVIGHEAFF